MSSSSTPLSFDEWRGGRLPHWFWWLALAVAFSWFWGLDARHLLRSDEGRYAEIAREMFVSGDWVTPRYNGLLYFEKPPFHLWMTALAYHAFGVGDWQARLWVGVSGAIGLLATAGAAARWFGPRVGLLSGLALLASPSWTLGSHFNSLDMGVSSALACVLAAVLCAQHPQATPRARRGFMWCAWAAMGVAVLTKGLIGIALPGLVLVVYTGVSRDWVLWRRLHLISGGALMLAITAPWFVEVAQRNPAFLQFFFIHEHWERYTSSVHERNAPFWYFVPQLLAGCLPWLGLAPQLGRVLRADAGPPGAFKPRWLLAIWAAAIFVFFSLSHSKLPGYLLPVFPPLAVLIALALERLDRVPWRRQLAGLSLLAALALGACAMAAVGLGANTPYRAYLPWLAAAAGLLAAGLLAAWWFARLPGGNGGQQPGSAAPGIEPASMKLKRRLPLPPAGEGRGEGRRMAHTGDAMAALLPSPPPSPRGRGSQSHQAIFEVQMCRINHLPFNSVLALALAFYVAATLALAGHESLGRGISGVDLVPAIQARLQPGMQIYGVRLLDHTLPFYLRHTVVPVEAPDELAFGVAQEPQKWLPTLAAFQTVWTNGAPALAIMSPATYRELQPLGLPLFLVAQDARRVVVSNTLMKPTLKPAASSGAAP